MSAKVLRKLISPAKKIVDLAPRKALPYLYGGVALNTVLAGRPLNVDVAESYIDVPIRGDGAGEIKEIIDNAPFVAKHPIIGSAGTFILPVVAKRRVLQKIRRLVANGNSDLANVYQRKEEKERREYLQELDREHAHQGRMLPLDVERERQLGMNSRANAYSATVSRIGTGLLRKM